MGKASAGRKGDDDSSAKSPRSRAGSSGRRPMGASRKVFGPAEAQPLEGPAQDIRPRNRLLRVETGRGEKASASIAREDFAGGWIRMPVRAPVTDPDIFASAEKDGETSDAKCVSSDMPTHR